MSKKLVILLLVVLALGLAACGGDDDKDDKKVDLKQTFTSESGLTVKYPDGWIARDGESGVEIANSQKTIDAMDSDTEEKMGADMAIAMVPPPTALADMMMEGKTIKEVAEQFKEIFAGDEGEDTSVSDVKEIKIGGKDAARLDITDSETESEGFYVFYMLDDANVMMVVGMAHQGDLGKYEDTLLKIIESVTYTAPAS